MKTSPLNPHTTWRHLLLAGVSLLLGTTSGFAQKSTGASTNYRHAPESETETVWLQNGPVQEPPQAGQTGPHQGPHEDASAVPAVEKNRKLSRTYAAANRPYNLETRYGRVQINTWSRNEIRTDVDIITRADTEEKAQQLQDMIQVQMTDADAATGGISFRSKFGAMPRECWSRTKLYEVNYTVWLPKNTQIRVYNTFGDISIPNDLTGSTELAVEYGALRVARLEGSQNLLRVGNGQGAISYVRKASIDASYSKLRLDAGQTVDLRNNHSDIDVGTVQDLTMHSKYGDVALGTVRNLSGWSGYSKFSIDKISERLDMTVQYCPSFEVRNTGRNFRQINVDGGYSTILLNFPDGAAFNFDVNTQHGKLLLDKRLVRVDSEENSPSSSDMQGQFGVMSVRKPASVNIKVRYGDVRFNR
ncbi:hypothetical protein [Hymenobacter elongatus]|uniref:Adhesin domain-containing protein n=1 Tax=Hymenobacter elongatus TaxID=877208 RepID=A0A4Z0PQ50_9BACT|nr:hypothetical protein [Hymenobacter elongatus]TGE19847.1 hypothetical protein E5J99_01745 [Hymenobacter elongatus]